MSADPRPPVSPGTVWLRLMATSDLHGHIMPFDDAMNRPAPGQGLAQVASLVDQARAECPQALLLDNGDFLNGSALSDFLAEVGAAAHPVIAAMNRMRFDAATLGNHEFSHGLGHLRQALAAAAFPVVASNLEPLGALPTVQPFVLLQRSLADGSGGKHRLTIGVTGALPPQTALWERRNLRGQLAVGDILGALRGRVAEMRGAGADLVVVLAHSGLGDGEEPAGAENVAHLVAELPGVDAVVAGHTHQCHPPAPGGGALVMPGFHGSHLGVMDLTLARKAGRWQVIGRQSHLRAVAERTGAGLRATVATDAGISAIAAPDLARMRLHQAQHIGQTRVRLTSHFALLGHSAIQNLLAEAQLAHIRPMLGQTDLPVLASSVPFKAGGRGGPENFTDIAPGPLTLRHMTDLYPHPNSPVVLRLTGAEVALWLERAVSLFCQVEPGRPDQPLIDPAFPAYNFDLIHGLSFAIDLTQPARFNARGAEVCPGSQRVTDLRHMGQPVTADQAFLVVTNSYRASGGAGFAGTDAANTVLEDDTPLRRVVQRHLQSMGSVAPPAALDWRFAPCPGASVVFATAPGAIPPAELALEPLGLQADGFLRFRRAL